MMIKHGATGAAVVVDPQLHLPDPQEHGDQSECILLQMKITPHERSRVQFFCALTLLKKEYKLNAVWKNTKIKISILHKLAYTTFSWR